MTGGSTNWRLGFTLSLTTAALWGLLPIALKVVLEGMDAYTIVWWRFAICDGGTRRFPRVARRLAAASRRGPRWRSRLLIVATLTLIGNYVLYLVALDHTTPSVTQVVIQLAPLMLLVGGVVVFHERFGRVQWIGFAVLGAGLLLFFNAAAAGTCAAGGRARPRRRAHGGRRRFLGGLRPRAEATAGALLRAAGAVDDLRRRGRRAAARERPGGDRTSSTACSSACSFSAAPIRSAPMAHSARRSITGTCRGSVRCLRLRRCSRSARCGPWSGSGLGLVPGRGPQCAVDRGRADGRRADRWPARSQ